MGFQPTGRHLIAGTWIAGDATGTPDLVDQACRAAEQAFWSYGYASPATHAEFLREIADEIEARADDITDIGTQETGLPAARLNGERGRTTGQLRMFADHIAKGGYLDRRDDAALPDRQPAPRPHLQMMQRPIGPVAVFGASNFPLAFSTAGGDTAAALAAGCPVVVKGHPAHPGTSEIVAMAIDAAIRRTGVHPGVFSLIQGGDDRRVGAALVTHPLMNAVGFTGSLAGGRALFDLCAARPTPIPFFGELGSVNPMFLMPAAMAARADKLGADWAASLCMGAGQFCTNPGIAVVLDGPDADAFTASAKAALQATAPQMMLTEAIAHAYHDGQARMAGNPAVTPVMTSDPAGRNAQPNLFQTDAAGFLSDPTLSEEIFGPLGLIVHVGSVDQMMELARGLAGQLTVTMHLDGADHDIARDLLPVLERKAGRILTNGFPTGVEVADAMVHGGPYPASTNFGATSVGTMSIRRFLRPVCYQNMPQDLMPQAFLHHGGTDD